MKIFIMTDLEGVAGVLDKHNWVLFESRYYDKAKILLTEEVNAACRGFLKGGADEIVICDGHGAGGIDPEILHEEAKLIRGIPEGYPCGLNESFDCVAWIGQHAKSGTEFAHLPHTGNHHVLDYTINDISVGEFGQLAMCAGQLDVKPIFASGDKALCIEAQKLLPGIKTVTVKEGRSPGSGNEYTYEEYDLSNSAALHLSPIKARKLIEKGAYEAISEYIKDRNSFTGIKLDPPYIKIIKYRASQKSLGYTYMSKSNRYVWDAINDPGKKI